MNLITNEEIDAVIESQRVIELTGDLRRGRIIMQQEDERKSAHSTNTITDRITKLKKDIVDKQTELERLERFVFLSQEP